MSILSKALISASVVSVLAEDKDELKDCPGADKAEELKALSGEYECGVGDSKFAKMDKKKLIIKEDGSVDNDKSDALVEPSAQDHTSGKEGNYATKGFGNKAIFDLQILLLTGIVGLKDGCNHHNTADQKHVDLQFKHATKIKGAVNGKGDDHEEEIVVTCKKGDGSGECCSKTVIIISVVSVVVVIGGIAAYFLLAKKGGNDGKGEDFSFHEEEEAEGQEKY
jgi:hypothetical protein